MKLTLTVMKKNHLNSTINSLVLIAVLAFFSSAHLSAQNAPIYLNWDKTGCQQDGIDKIIIDENLENAPCLLVCRNSATIYRLISEDIGNITKVNWSVIGGKIDTNDEFSFINWDDADFGEINIEIIYADNTIIQRSICVEKEATHLVLGWDGIGCQNQENNKSEMKLNGNIANIPCLNVCKENTTTYYIYGEDTNNISNVKWLITGGLAENPDDFKTTIIWDNNPTGVIGIRITNTNGSIVQKNICVNKIDSSLLLEWEKIEENTIREIKIDNNEINKEGLLVNAFSTINYKIEGKSKENVASIEWEVKGGIINESSNLNTTVTWLDEEEKKLTLNITYNDGTEAEQKIAVLQLENKVPPNGGGAQDLPNSIKFTYDLLTGSQIKRELIYIAPATTDPDLGLTRQIKPSSIKHQFNEKNLVVSEQYNDISYYPNPVVSELFIKWTNLNDSKVERIAVYSLTGKLIKNIEVINSESTTIDFQSYPSGYYNLILSYTNGVSKNFKIIKK